MTLVGSKMRVTYPNERRKPTRPPTWVPDGFIALSNENDLIKVFIASMIKM
jgi:hypothetical protein